MQLLEAARLARTLMDKHGLTAWTFKFDHAKRRFGCCDYTHKVISLSKHLTLLNGETEVRDTILHEIAHALTPGDYHGLKWRAKCLEIGATPTRCFRGDQVKQPPANYLLVCRHCGFKQSRYRRTRQPVACRVCCNRYNNGKFSQNYQLHWEKPTEGIE